MLNQCQFIGNIGAEPESRATQQGKKVVRFNIACTERWTDKQGAKQEKTDWIPVVIFSEGLASIAEKYLHKGSRVFVQGKFTTSRWQDKDGKDRFTTEVVLQGFDAKMIMLSSAKEVGETSETTDRPTPNHAARSIIDDGSDIPF